MKKTNTQKSPKVASKSSPSTNTISVGPKEGVKMLGILHLVGNILSGGTLGIVLVLAYFLIRKDELSELEKKTCYEIINFNLSFIIYTCIAGILFWLGMLLIFILIGFILLPILPIVYVTWIVLMIMGFLRHLEGENYQYPLIIRFIS